MAGLGPGAGVLRGHRVSRFNLRRGTEGRCRWGSHRLGVSRIRGTGQDPQWSRALRNCEAGLRAEWTEHSLLHRAGGTRRADWDNQEGSIHATARCGRGLTVLPLAPGWRAYRLRLATLTQDQLRPPCIDILPLSGSLTIGIAAITYRSPPGTGHRAGSGGCLPPPLPPTPLACPRTAIVSQTGTQQEPPPPGLQSTGPFPHQGVFNAWWQDVGQAIRLTIPAIALLGSSTTFESPVPASEVHPLTPPSTMADPVQGATMDRILQEISAVGHKLEEVDNTMASQTAETRSMHLDIAGF
ncbi:hypothetical protein NDU88_000070 [Pleurodeles waltl]|uniref:Uncharacterized protein n=1 Tax=Pleurodeles waltl TaxID=8319 RepID=A0AAV7VX30_PLEWA|nr:hypothetical protein NDU88_000070 [Pleurodeles waltl]